MILQEALSRLSGSGRAPCDLGEHLAGALASAVLDGGADDLELGALLEQKAVMPDELRGYAHALKHRCSRLTPPAASARPVVFACYRGVRECPHLLPVVALTLARLGVPVLVHGALDGGGGVAAAQVFRELGMFPCASLAQAQARLDDAKLAFVPAAVLAPGLAAALALKGRLGFGGLAQSLARLLAPFGSEALYVVSPSAAMGSALLREHLAAGELRALLLDGVEGEPFANPRRRPRIEYILSGSCSLLYDSESQALALPATLPAAIDARAVASWMRRALRGEAPIPLPILNQLACCLYGSGYAVDMNEAKAVVAVETGSLAAT